MEILKRDHVASRLLLFVGLWWGVMGVIGAIYLRQAVSRDPDERVLVLIFGVLSFLITVVCAGIAFIRVRDIRRVLFSGVEVAGRVAQLHFNSEDVGSVLFEYSYGGKTYRGRNVTGDRAATERFSQGQEVALMVDPGEPSRSYIKEIYRGGSGAPV